MRRDGRGVTTPATPANIHQASSAVGTSWPRSESRPARPIPSTPGVSQRGSPAISLTVSASALTPSSSQQPRPGAYWPAGGWSTCTSPGAARGPTIEPFGDGGVTVGARRGPDREAGEADDQRPGVVVNAEDRVGQTARFWICELEAPGMDG